MNFDFSAEQKALAEQARRFLAAECPTSAVRTVLERGSGHDERLWKGLAEMGFLGVVVPERFGGLGLSHLDLCVVAEELGRALAPVPFSSSVSQATEFLLAAGSSAQQERWLPQMVTGDAIGTFAFAERAGPVTPQSIQLRARNTASGVMLNGSKLAVPDAGAADFAVVAARSAPGRDARGISLYLVELNQSGVSCTEQPTVDPSRSHGRIDFVDARAELLGRAGDAGAIISQVFNHAAVLTAFEQIGGADRSLEMARDYALDRMAFGRPIGSFQAIKHMLADMYVSATLARSNSYYGAWALSTGSAELPVAAATARVSATEAFQHCAKNNIQVHGGVGFTWAYDCHLFYRRANLLAVSLGSLSQWEDALIERMREQKAA